MCHSRHPTGAAESPHGMLVRIGLRANSEAVGQQYRGTEYCEHEIFDMQKGKGK